LEHFGIDRSGNTAPYIDARRYKEAIQWKRDLHREHDTRLIETFSYFNDGKNGLVRNLERLLRAEDVEPRRLTEEEIERITAEANIQFSAFVGLIGQFLVLVRGSGADRQAVTKKAASARDLVFLDIFWPIHDAYQSQLQELRQIDFDDMINGARAHVRAGRFQSPYTHIIVDEFQDISENRLALLLDLRASHPCRLFVVGDDWQSIYRFAGCDVGIITDLAARVGATERVDLNMVFRYSQELIDLTSAFITANPTQLRKTLRSHHGASGTPPVTVLLTTQRPTARSEAGVEDDTPSPLHTVAADIVERAEGQPAHVLVLGRYNHGKPKELATVQRLLGQRKITVDFQTVHRAKGSEAEFVVVVDLESGDGGYGFPSAVADDAVLRMVLSAGESFPYAEERRLFYVALTRAKQHAYLLAPADVPSSFLRDELLTEAFGSLVIPIGEVSKRFHCPRCQGLTIRRVEKAYGPIWECVNRPICHGRIYPCGTCGHGLVARTVHTARGQIFRCESCHTEKPTCPRCRAGYLEERTGNRGPFLACSAWNRGDGCLYTDDARVTQAALS
jgi:DNA helicase-4